MKDFPENLLEMLPEDWAEVAKDRECGECDACCTVLYVADLDKPAGKPCQHLHPEGHGCQIHDLRPQICRSWFCGWRFGFGNDTHRPDRCGVMVALPNANTNACQVFLDMEWDGKSLDTLHHTPALMIESLARTGAPIHIYVTGGSEPVATIVHKESALGSLMAADEEASD